MPVRLAPLVNPSPTLPPHTKHAHTHLFPCRSDPELTFVGFSWDGADEGKMVQTFGAGRALFARFIDLQRVSWRTCMCVCVWLGMSGL